MSIEIKSLTNGTPTPDDKNQRPIAAFNTIPNLDVMPNSNPVFNLYTVPLNKTALIQNIRVKNLLKHTVSLSLYMNRPTKLNGNTVHQRLLLLPRATSVLAGHTLIDDAELTLEAGDSIQGEVYGEDGPAIQYAISGVECDVT
jgi:hypothetical protein